jgi:MerR family transcriptional regulator, light-induced transcriptional regulator
MSPLEKSASHKTMRSKACEWLNTNVEPIAQAITARTFAENPDLHQKYGERGRKKCEEDTVYHLHYLSQAIAANRKKMFVDYVGWAKIMLYSRGIDPASLGDNLESMAHVLRLKSPRHCRSTFAQFIRSASAQLPKLPDTLPSFIDPTNPFSELANSYLKSLLLLNRDDAISLTLQQLERGLTIQDLFKHVIYPVQREVGRLWQENRITVLQEHYCTAATDLLIARLKHKTRGVPRSVTALAVCPDGEEHSLGIKMFSDLLEADGWRVAYIGPKCPSTDVLQHVKAYSVDLVAISVATPLNLSNTRDLITRIKSLEHPPSILIGGAAVNSNPELWKHLAADGASADVSDGVDMANRLVRQRKPDRTQQIAR